MKKIIIFAFAAFVLSGCTSPEERAQNQISQCLNMGFSLGTQAFADCRLQLESNDFQRRQAMAAAFSQGMNSVGQMYQRPLIQTPTGSAMMPMNSCQIQPNGGGYSAYCQ